MKRVKRVLLALIIMILVTGCGENNSPESVAKAMAKKLSNGNYKDVSKLITSEKDAYIDETAFKEYLEDNDLDIVGNKTIKVLKNEQDDEDPDKETVKIEIDDEYVLHVNTKKENKKWYVNIDYDISDNVTILVPKDSKIKINGKEIPKKYKKESVTESLSCGIYCSYIGSTYSPFNIERTNDKYVIPKMLDGSYDFEITSTNGSYDKELNIYGSDKVLDMGLELTKTKEEEMTKYLKNTFQGILTALENNKDMDKIKSYYTKDLWKSAETEYKSIKVVDNRYTTFVIKYKDIKLKDLTVSSAYELGDKIVMNGTYTYTFVKEQTYIKTLSGTNKYNREKSYNFTIVLEPDGKNGYLINSGTGDIIVGQSLY